MEGVKLDKLLTHQQRILSKIAIGQNLDDILEEICYSIEEMIDEKSAKCSILSLEGNQLFHRSAPSIDNDFCEAVNGVVIGDNVGSCGTAAFLKSQIIVDDIETSALWEDFKDLALKFSFKSCWSTPILSTESRVLGTFAIYHTIPRAPSKSDLALIDRFVSFSSIALERHEKSLEMEKLMVNLQQSNDKFHAFTEVMPDLTLIISEDGEYTDIYGPCEELLYGSINSLMNQNVNDVLPPKDAEPIMHVIHKTLSQKQVQIFEYQLEVQKGKVTFEGRTAPISNYLPNNPSKRHIVWIARDISIRKQAEKEIEKLAFYDPLTHLPNRRMLTERLERCVERIKRTKKTAAILFLDLDNFKRINDSLGHSAGDELLIKVAKRLSIVIRSSDTLARVGGDEFILLLEYVGDDNEQSISETEVVAQKIQETFNEKFLLGDSGFQVGCSIGICLINHENAILNNIMKFADTAMYRSKKQGGQRYSFYDPQLQSMLEKQTEIEVDIVRAIGNSEFCAYFQPQIDTLGQVVGAEALIRWHHPVHGVIMPNDFIFIAEQCGLIQALQNIVLRDICILINRLADENIINENFCVSINISHCQFSSLNLRNELLKVLNTYNVKPSQIKLEITESMLSTDIENTIEQMNRLHESGIKLSIDDFGTGYSSLKHLSDFPVEELKIDKRFIDKVCDQESGFNIVKTIINLAKNLNLSVVAEGVEKIEQFELLNMNNVDSIQGYYISKPIHQEDYVKWHKQNIALNF